MLQRLTIENYVLIDSLEISFPAGLVILSGETGAGKSVLLGALSLLFGARADAAAVLKEDRNCVVEAEFSDGTLLRRVISRSGRSRAFLNDEPVPLAELAAETRRRIDIHAQHSHLLLADSRFQLSVIDRFADTGQELADYRESYARCRSLREAIRQAEAELEQAVAERDYREFQFRQLEEARLVPGELERLEDEHRRLAHAGELREGLAGVLASFRYGESSLDAVLKDAEHGLERLSRLMDGLHPLAERLHACRIELADIDADLEHTAEGLEISPQRLQEVEDRMSRLYDLLKRHRCSDIGELIGRKEELDRQLSDTGILEERLSGLRKELEQAERDTAVRAAALGGRRRSALPALCREIEQGIRALEMPFARFEIAASAVTEYLPDGCDRFEFRFSANGGDPADISRTASGGELSRVMLVLKALMARFAEMPTLVFDEIDTGVSGKTADRMGRMIGEMGRSMQIFAITHLPQIASRPGAHYLVYKEFDAQRNPRTRLKLLSAEERVREVARMLSGSELTPAALANAQEMIKLNSEL